MPRLLSRRFHDPSDSRVDSNRRLVSHRLLELRPFYFASAQRSGFLLVPAPPSIGLTLSGIRLFAYCAIAARREFPIRVSRLVFTMVKRVSPPPPAHARQRRSLSGSGIIRKQVHDIFTKVTCPNAAPQMG